MTTKQFNPLPMNTMPQPNRSSKSLIWFFILVGVVAIGCGAWNLLRGLRCEHWQATEGVIQTAQMKYHSSKGGGTYSASISYQYQVAGIRYTGTRLAFGEMESSSAHARAILNRFPVGKKVPVHHAPDDPELAVFHWVSFGPGERIGTATTPFSRTNGVNLKTCFAAFTILFDLALLAGLARRLIKGRQD